MAESTASGPKHLSYDLGEPQSVVDTPGAGPGNLARSYAMSWTVQEDELASTLEDCESVFQSGLLQLHDISIKDLVFCKPSKDDDILSPPPLQSYVTANTQFMQYHDWVVKLYLETENINCGGFKQCRCMKDQLVDDLQNEWTKLEELKCRAWQMASLLLDMAICHKPIPHFST
jgi:hypothetical protein